MPQRAPILWLTGLPASGKSTLAGVVARRLAAMSGEVEVLDGEAARARLSPTLGFSRDDREEHARRLATEARRIADTGLVRAVVVAAVSPYRELRARARALAGPPFVEIFVSCPLAVCRARDPKGLYAAAAAGRLTGLTGVDAPYEPPLAPELEIETAEADPECAAGRVIAWLLDRHLVAPFSAP